MIILQNLIDNAIKFTDKVVQIVVVVRDIEGGHRLRRCRHRRGYSLGKRCRLSLTSFRQVDSSITRVHGGIGLGLHIVKAFSEMLGGTIAVKSELNKGSTFTLTLPVDSVGPLRVAARTPFASRRLRPVISLDQSRVLTNRGSMLRPPCPQMLQRIRQAGQPGRPRGALDKPVLYLSLSVPALRPLFQTFSKGRHLQESRGRPREYERLPVNFPATLAAGGVNGQGLVVDISIGGCSFHTRSSTRRGTSCAWYCRFPTKRIRFSQRSGHRPKYPVRSAPEVVILGSSQTAGRGEPLQHFMRHFNSDRWS